MQPWDAVWNVLPCHMPPAQFGASSARSTWLPRATFPVTVAGNSVYRIAEDVVPRVLVPHDPVVGDRRRTIRIADIEIDPVAAIVNHLVAGDRQDGDTRCSTRRRVRSLGCSRSGFPRASRPTRSSGPRPAHSCVRFRIRRTHDAIARRVRRRFRSLRSRSGRGGRGRPIRHVESRIVPRGRVAGQGIAADGDRNPMLPSLATLDSIRLAVPRSIATPSSFPISVRCRTTFSLPECRLRCRSRAPCRS